MQLSIADTSIISALIRALQSNLILPVVSSMSILQNIFYSFVSITRNFRSLGVRSTLDHWYCRFASFYELLLKILAELTASVYFLLHFSHPSLSLQLIITFVSVVWNILRIDKCARLDLQSIVLDLLHSQLLLLFMLEYDNWFFISPHDLLSCSEYLIANSTWEMDYLMLGLKGLDRDYWLGWAVDLCVMVLCWWIFYWLVGLSLDAFIAIRYNMNFKNKVVQYN